MKPDTLQPHPLRLRPLAACLAVALAAGAAPGSARFAGAISSLDRPHGPISVVVTNCDDSGPGSLRAAFFNALDGGTIDLGQLSCSTISLTSGALVDQPTAGYVTLQGPYGRILTIDGNHSGRVIAHHGSRLALRDLSIVNGSFHSSAGGGCIYSSEDVVLVDATVSGCSVSTSGVTPALGGGIRALGVVFVLASRVLDNRAEAAAADSAGGGIHARYLITDNGSTISGNVVAGDGSHLARGGGGFGSEGARVGYSTISGNSAGSGGGLFVSDASFYNSSINDSTISGNHADGAGGGIHTQFNIRTSNSTIVFNSATFDFGAGLYIADGNANLQSTIIAGNTSGDGLNASDVGGHAGAVISGDDNLVIASTLPLPPGTIDEPPLLGPLQDNGGKTLTHALLPGSPAIDAGNNQSGFQTDQRSYDCGTTLERAPSGCVNFERVIGPSADIGAFEFGAPDVIFDDGFDPVS